MQLIVQLLRRVYWFQEAALDSFEMNGLAPVTRTQSMVISTIVGGEYRAANIARLLGVSRQAVGQILADLEAMGFVELTPDPKDRRSKIVSLRPEFVAEGASHPVLFDALEEELGRRIGRKNVSRLREILATDWGEPPQVSIADKAG